MKNYRPIIVLTQTVLDYNLLNNLIAYNFFKNKKILENIDNDDIELNSFFQKKINENRLFVEDFVEKDEIVKKIANYYVKNTQANLLFLGNLDFYSLPLQEGLLRFLEEPPANLQIILYSQNLDRILPTISSRSIVEVLSDDWIIKTMNKKLLEKVANNLPNIKDTVNNLIKNIDLVIPNLAKIERLEIDFWLWQLLFYFKEIYKINPDFRTTLIIKKIVDSMILNDQLVQKKLVLANLSL